MYDITMGCKSPNIQKKGVSLMKKLLALTLLAVLCMGLIPAFPIVANETAAPAPDLFAEATWEKGSFYDKPEPNKDHADIRRYTTIPCKEGETYTFKFPSTNWRLFLYPADADGSINGDWIELKDGLEYSVTAINGRMPSVLRVTACPNPDGKITDDMWAKFDVQCYRTVVELNLFASATWNKGAFYHTETPNTALAETRRYTTIPCKEGDVYSFKFNSSNWNPYLYPADENGSIDGTYVQITDGMEYHVKAINGRVPTTLRITVCPNPDGVITDDMWAKFDVDCRLAKTNVSAGVTDYNLFRTADWQLGSYYGNAVHGGQDRRHAIFPCEKNDTFTFEFGNQDFGLWIYYYDKDGEIADFGYTTVTETTEVRITEKNGKVPSELRISVYPIVDGEISEDMWKEKFQISCTRETNHIKVATMNYGLWNDGGTKFVPDNKVEEVLAKWKAMLDDHDVDILCGQEWLKFFDRSNKVTAEDALFAYKYKYQFSTASGFGKNLVSKLPVTDFQVIAHTKNTSRMYTKAYTEINGKRVCLINAHLSIETDFYANRKAEYDDLLKVMKEEEYVIVFGDFNAYTGMEFRNFTQAGYVLANCGKFGVFDTWTNFDKPSSWGNKAIDNIIVSPNIEILSVVCDRRDLSDHNMLVAELLLLDEVPSDTEDNTDTSTDASTTDTVTDTVTNDTSVPATDTEGPADNDNSKSVLPIVVTVGVVVVAAAALCFFLFRKKGAASK